MIILEKLAGVEGKRSNDATPLRGQQVSEPLAQSTPRWMRPTASGGWWHRDSETGSPPPSQRTPARCDQLIVTLALKNYPWEGHGGAGEGKPSFGLLTP